MTNADITRTVRDAIAKETRVSGDGEPSINRDRLERRRRTRSQGFRHFRRATAMKQLRGADGHVAGVRHFRAKQREMKRAYAQGAEMSVWLNDIRGDGKDFRHSPA